MFSREAPTGRTSWMNWPRRPRLNRHVHRVAVLIVLSFLNASGERAGGVLMAGGECVGPKELLYTSIRNRPTAAQLRGFLETTLTQTSTARPRVLYLARGTPQLYDTVRSYAPANLELVTLESDEPHEVFAKLPDCEAVI